ncbi:MAG: hypothetical protein ACTHOU_14265, partial [Aureliella sp.]
MSSEINVADHAAAGPASRGGMWKAVIVALLLGILFGTVAEELIPSGYHHDIATVLQTVTDLFLRLI